MNFNEYVRETIKSSGDITYNKVARATGLSINYIFNIAKGKSDPSKEAIERIAGYLGADPADFREYRKRVVEECGKTNPVFVDKVYKVALKLQEPKNHA